VPDLIMVVHFH